MCINMNLKYCCIIKITMYINLQQLSIQNQVSIQTKCSWKIKPICVLVWAFKNVFVCCVLLYYKKFFYYNNALYKLKQAHKLNAV